MSVREMVTAIQLELRDPDLQPGRATEIQRILTSLLGNINAEIRQADVEYATVLLKHLDADEAASRAKIRAETSPEYVRKQEARHTKELVQEMIAAIKYQLRAITEELRLTR